MGLFLKSNRLSLNINAAIWSVCAAVLLGFGLFFYGFEKHQLETQIAQAEVLLDAVYQQKREELANEIFAGHREAVAAILNEIMKVKGIAAVSVFDLNGSLLEALGLDAPAYRNLDVRLRKNPAGGARFEQITVQNRPYLTLSTVIQVIGEHQGYFYVFFDLSDLYRASHQRLLLILAIFGGMLVVLSLVLHLLLTRSVIQPVRNLRKAMGDVMTGLLGAQVALRRDDEIGEVADAFNSMSTQLQVQHQRLIRSMQARDTYAAQLEETNRELAHLNADLETMVEDRTRELRTSYEELQKESQERIRADQEKHALEERLARSQKMEALGLLAGGVAHDLNNVLSGIVSYPELILMDLPEQHPLRPIVATIQKSGQKAAAIVQDLLALARRSVTNMTVLNLNQDVIAEYLESPEFKKLCSYHPLVEVETALARDLMNMKGSAVHLRKALMNLVSNAAESQPEGGRILIQTENRYVDQWILGYEHVTEGDYVVLRVTDWGSGIAAEDLNRIFEPFYTKKVMGRSGTGLGMAVVWGTVQDHKGYVNVESQEAQGTCFELYFPVSRAMADVRDAERTISMANLMSKGETVLVIDDVPEQREIASHLLQRLGYQVTVVSSGEAAVEYLEDHQADILILDMIMDPGMDGLDTYLQILQRHPGQKAVIASGYAENERVDEALRLGAGAYIRKPYTMDKIAMALRKELDRASR